MPQFWLGVGGLPRENGEPCEGDSTPSVGGDFWRLRGSWPRGAVAQGSSLVVTPWASRTEGPDGPSAGLHGRGLPAQLTPGPTTVTLEASWTLPGSRECRVPWGRSGAGEKGPSSPAYAPRLSFGGLLGLFKFVWPVLLLKVRPCPYLPSPSPLQPKLREACLCFPGAVTRTFPANRGT